MDFARRISADATSVNGSVHAPIQPYEKTSAGLLKTYLTKHADSESKNVQQPEPMLEAPTASA